MIRRFKRYKEPIMSVEECRKAVRNANLYLLKKGYVEPEGITIVPAPKKKPGIMRFPKL